MRKLAVLLLMVGLTGCFSLPKLFIGAGASAVIANAEPDNLLNNTYQVDVLARIEIGPLQIAGSYGWKTYDYYNGELDESGTLTVMPVAVTIRYVLSAGIARVLIGAGLVWNAADVTGIATITNMEDVQGYRIVLGADFKLPAGFKLGIEAHYDFTEAEIMGALTGDTSVDLGGFVAGLTLAYHF